MEEDEGEEEGRIEFRPIILPPGIEIEVKESEIFETLEKHPDWVFDLALALNPNLKKEAQEQLADHEWWFVRAKLAFNPKLKKSIQFKLAKDKDKRIREIIAARKDATRKVLKYLSNDESEEVRQIVASHPLPKNIWKKMLRDKNENEDVKILIASNNKLEKEDIKNLLGERKYNLLLAVCLIQKIDLDLFKEVTSLASSDSKEVYAQLFKEIRDKKLNLLV
jgi:hypothetical protein